MKKAQQDLLSKQVHSTAIGDKEIQLYRCMSVASDDVLAPWNSQKDNSPRLSLLARTVLATSALSE
jgi:hypothetical protein